MVRRFNYSDKTTTALGKNGAHQFASRFALEIYNSDSIYSFIPKNACSTLRFSVAIANGCLSPKSDVAWIHNNNMTFSADLSALVKAKYSFVILRCPFRRVLSAFLDKFLDRTPDSWNYFQKTNREVPLNHLTFKTFIKSLKNPGVLKSNIHWRPQNDFLVYQEYDDYYSLESFSLFEAAIKDKIGLAIYDTRLTIGHHITTKTTSFLNNACDIPILELMSLKNENNLPTYESFYNEELVEMVGNIYKDDVSFYHSKFGSKNMLFPTFK